MVVKEVKKHLKSKLKKNHLTYSSDEADSDDSWLFSLPRKRKTQNSDKLAKQVKKYKLTCSLLRGRVLPFPPQTELKRKRHVVVLQILVVDPQVTRA